jgi:adenylosuccinate lyase
MPISPIESRYRTEMCAYFEESARLKSWLRVEVALAKAHARLGHIPQAAAAEIERAAGKVRPERVSDIEAETHHDLMAMVKALSEQCKKYGGYVHYGATSYDIEDTALALTMRDASALIRLRLISLRKVVKGLALEKVNMVCMGRTHGQHAVPTTYGMKFALYHAQLGRHIQRLDAATKRISVGKMTGAVGTMATFGADAFELQSLVMADLGLEADPISSQVISRDRHAEMIFTLALIAATLQQMAQEVRNLQRTEIGEIAEPFAAKQVGSSTMPQKRNPHKSERVCSLARIVRAQVAVALENIPTEHERDLTNSAAERYIFPEAFITCDYMLKEMQKIMAGLQFFPAQIEKNLQLSGGLALAERIMIELTKKGMGRPDAHELMRNASRLSLTQRVPLREVLISDPLAKKYLKAHEIDALLDARTYTGQARAIVKKALDDGVQ